MTYVRFAYLVQGQAHLVERFDYLQSENSDLFYLTFDKPLDMPAAFGVFDPLCTWAEGRNLLLEESRKVRDYAYFIFLDDDTELLNFTFADFEKVLLEYRPYMGVPLADVIEDSGRWCPKIEVQQPVAFDQIVQAYSWEAVRDRVLVPFVTKFDTDSWWYSCEINNYLGLTYFQTRIAQFNFLRVRNGRHLMNEPPETFVGNYRGGISTEGLRTVSDWLETKCAVAGVSLMESRTSPIRPCPHQLATDFRVFRQLVSQWRFLESVVAARRLLKLIVPVISTRRQRQPFQEATCLTYTRLRPGS